MPPFMIWEISEGEFAGDDSGIAVDIFGYMLLAQILRVNIPKRSTAFVCAQQGSHENCFC